MQLNPFDVVVFLGFIITVVTVGIVRGGQFDGLPYDGKLTGTHGDDVPGDGLYRPGAVFRNDFRLQVSPDWRLLGHHLRLRCRPRARRCPRWFAPRSGPGW